MHSIKNVFLSVQSGRCSRYITQRKTLAGDIWRHLGWRSPRVKFQFQIFFSLEFFSSQNVRKEVLRWPQLNQTTGLKILNCRLKNRKCFFLLFSTKRTFFSPKVSKIANHYSLGRIERILQKEISNVFAIPDIFCRWKNEPNEGCCGVGKNGQISVFSKKDQQNINVR